MINQMLCPQGPGGHEARECENTPAALKWSQKCLRGRTPDRMMGRMGWWGEGVEDDVQVEFEGPGGEGLREEQVWGQ